MSDQTFHIPRRSELVAVLKSAAKFDVKPLIEAALDDDAVIAKIETYKTNGGFAGDAKIDDIRAMDIVLMYDEDHGGAIRRSGLKEAEILSQVNVCLRRRYVLDKKRKIVGINTKRFKLLPRE